MKVSTNKTSHGAPTWLAHKIHQAETPRLQLLCKLLEEVAENQRILQCEVINGSKKRGDTVACVDLCQVFGSTVVLVSLYQQTVKYIIQNEYSLMEREQRYTKCFNYMEECRLQCNRTFPLLPHSHFLINVVVTLQHYTLYTESKCFILNA